MDTGGESQCWFSLFKDTLLNHNNAYSHSRHLSKDDCCRAGLNVIDLEDNQKLQDCVLSLHHCYMILIDMINVLKIVENQ